MSSREKRSRYDHIRCPSKTPKGEVVFADLLLLIDVEVGLNLDGEALVQDRVLDCHSCEHYSKEPDELTINDHRRRNGVMLYKGMRYLTRRQYPGCTLRTMLLTL